MACLVHGKLSFLNSRKELSLFGKLDAFSRKMLLKWIRNGEEYRSGRKQLSICSVFLSSKRLSCIVIWTVGLTVYPYLKSVPRSKSLEVEIRPEIGMHTQWCLLTVLPVLCLKDRNTRDILLCKVPWIPQWLLIRALPRKEIFSNFCITCYSYSS